MSNPNEDPNQKSAGEDTLMEQTRKEKGANVETQADDWAGKSKSQSPDDKDQ
ncbi:hypothetical protein [Saccharibacillus qingshengii]|uniref:hypothetical protein n=1 Tax=Saccharibacillus qingshengii TaxID=1763540 RepID=UPI0015552F3E|nr:hypothetical protein [Saccharibacillus qingshengii]